MIGVDRLRLEVAVPSSVPVNLIVNPDGGDGTTGGWETPVAGSSLVASSAVDSGIDGAKLIYTTQGSVSASYLWTTPGEVAGWVAALWEIPFLEAGFVRGRIEFLDLNGALVGSEPGGYHAASAIPHLLGPVRVPAGATQARMRFDVYSTESGGHPAAGTQVYLRRVTMASAEDATVLGTRRVNLIPDPSFEKTTSEFSDGWVGDVPERVTSATVPPYHGVQAAQFDTDASFARATVDGPYGAGFCGPLYPGEELELSAAFRTHSLSVREVEIAVFWYDAAGNFVGSYVVQGNEIYNQWVVVTDTVIVPAGVEKAVIRFEALLPSSSQDRFLDRCYAGTPGGYFDGDTPDTIDGENTIQREWSDAPQLSVSTEITSKLYTVANEPFTWQDILGPTHELKIARRAFDAGTLTATILDPTLDPTQAETLRPGVGARVMLDAAEDDWQPLILTTIDDVHVTYVPDLRIKLTASDAMKQLTTAKRHDGVETIAELAYVLEGTGVAWSLNGDSSQPGGTYTTVSQNFRASAADQVVIVRDMVHGYAWVSRDGLVIVNDQAHMSAVTAVVLDEAAYSGIEIDYSTQAVINSVTVVWLRYDGADTIEVAYGPYEDEASIEEYGRRPATFKLHGATESAAAIQAFADDVLASTAVPVRVPRKVVVPIRDDGDRGYALADLYDAAQVVNVEKGVDAVYRLTSIDHEIRATTKGGRWVMTSGFDVEGYAAPPQVVPSP